MLNTGIVIIAASPVLATALQRIISRQMAVSIMRSTADLGDETAVVESLSSDGFCGTVISGLLHDAREIASQLDAASIVASPRQIQ